MCKLPTLHIFHLHFLSFFLNLLQQHFFSLFFPTSMETSLVYAILLLLLDYKFEIFLVGYVFFAFFVLSKFMFNIRTKNEAKSFEIPIASKKKVSFDHNSFSKYAFSQALHEPPPPPLVASTTNTNILNIFKQNHLKLSTQPNWHPNNIQQHVQDKHFHVDQILPKKVAFPQNKSDLSNIFHSESSLVPKSSSSFASPPLRTPSLALVGNACWTHQAVLKYAQDKAHTDEKERREMLNKKYHSLRELVPKPIKPDRLSLVEETIKFIKELQRKVKEEHEFEEKKRSETDQHVEQKASAIQLQLQQQPVLNAHLLQDTTNPLQRTPALALLGNTSGTQHGILKFAKDKGGKTKGYEEMREMLNKKHDSLRELIPKPIKPDRLSVVDETIKYIKELQRLVKTDQHVSTDAADPIQSDNNEWNTNGVQREIQIQRQNCGSTSVIAERERRDKFNHKYHTLKELIPKPNMKSDRASVIGEAIEYIKELLRTVSELKLLVEKKTRGKAKSKRLKTEQHDSTGEAKPDHSYNNDSLTSSWLEKKSGKDSEVSVRIIDDEVRIKLVPKKKSNWLLVVCKALDELQLELHHLSSGQAGEHFSFVFKTKINEGCVVNNGASEIANKLIQAVEQ